MRKLIIFWIMMSVSTACYGGEEQPNPVFSIFDTFPYYWLEDDPENPRRKGLYTELVNLIAHEAGQDFTLRTHPFARVLYSLKTGNTDFSMIALIDNKGRGVNVVAPLVCSSMILIPRKGSGIRTLKDIKGKRIAFTGRSVFEKSGYTKQDIIPVRLSQPRLYFSMMVTGRLDAFVMNEVMYYAYLQHLAQASDFPEDFLSYVGDPVRVTGYQLGLVVSQKSAYAHLVPRLTESVRRLHERGAIQETFRRYGSDLPVTCSGEAQE
mgnify:CR=1 FL=1|tara:strand:+ start:7532 stop:8326 length:795 start_codon:yes stop_codon:yes gene_type:complete